VLRGVLAHVKGDETCCGDYATTTRRVLRGRDRGVFFERPKQLSRELPELYGVCAASTNLDLAARG